MTDRLFLDYWTWAYVGITLIFFKYGYFNVLPVGNIMQSVVNNCHGVLLVSCNVTTQAMSV